MVLAGTLTVLLLPLLFQSFLNTVLLRRKPQFHPTLINPPQPYLLYEHGISLLQKPIYLSPQYCSGGVHCATTRMRRLNHICLRS